MHVLTGAFPSNAYESLGNLEDAINMGYKKAVELEPGSQDTQQALAAAEAALRRKVRIDGVSVYACVGVCSLFTLRYLL